MVDQPDRSDSASHGRPLLGGLVVLYFVIALEVLIMISPFAAFFYAVFNPVLLFLARWPSTGWLAAFFLPHMVMPPDLLLMALRVAGSVLLIGGAVVFLACAAQVYYHKLARRGPALGGLYRWIRHPQYVALAVTGVGLAILWPRLLTAALWAVMVTLYYVLALDEERRMTAQFGDQYRDYAEKTGRFAPRPVGRLFARLPWPRRPVVRVAAVLVVWLALSVGTALALRAYTVARLPLWSDGRVAALPVLTGDGMLLDHRMADILQLPEVRSRLADGTGAVLAYLVPPGYIMQGMIADTDPTWRLYARHQTFAMIVDWVLHPFRHLRGGHAMMHGGAHGGAVSAKYPMARRLIFLRVDGARAGNRADLFGIGRSRTPLFFVDVDFPTLTVLAEKDLGPGTGWGRVPTPMF